MSKEITACLDDGRAIVNGNFEVDDIPDTCPSCFHTIEPIKRFGWYEKKYVGEISLQIIFQCPKQECRRLFIAYYKHRGDVIRDLRDTLFFSASAPWNIKKREFSKTIAEISPKFCEIYNQARAAELRGYKEICGAGYRRAIEFLIKDYIIRGDEKKRETIEQKWLGKCIDEHIEDERIKGSAKRATWLGNDETHYIREFKDKDLDDLKALIDLTVLWMESVDLLNKYFKEMPEK